MNNRSNQLNPNNKAYYSSRNNSHSNMNNRSNQLNPNNKAYHSSRNNSHSNMNNRSNQLNPNNKVYHSSRNNNKLNINNNSYNDEIYYSNENYDYNISNSLTPILEKPDIIDRNTLDTLVKLKYGNNQRYDLNDTIELKYSIKKINFNYDINKYNSINLFNYILYIFIIREYKNFINIVENMELYLFLKEEDCYLKIECQNKDLKKVKDSICNKLIEMIDKDYENDNKINIFSKRNIDMNNYLENFLNYNEKTGDNGTNYLPEFYINYNLKQNNYFKYNNLTPLKQVGLQICRDNDMYRNLISKKYYEYYSGINLDYYKNDYNFNIRNKFFKSNYKSYEFLNENNLYEILEKYVEPIYGNNKYGLGNIISYKNYGLYPSIKMVKYFQSKIENKSIKEYLLKKDKIDIINIFPLLYIIIKENLVKVINILNDETLYEISLDNHSSKKIYKNKKITNCGLLKNDNILLELDKSYYLELDIFNSKFKEYLYVNYDEEKSIVDINYEKIKKIMDDDILERKEKLERIKEIV